jgi:hypothetical protein
MGCCRWGNDTDRAPTVPPPRPTTEIDLLAARRSDAERDLVAATGGGAVCRIDGDVVGTVKYQEGRLAAVAELQRAVRAHRDEPLDLARRHLETWTAEAAAVQDRGTAWRAYRAGGVAELTGTVQALGGERHPTPAPDPA